MPSTMPSSGGRIVRRGLRRGLIAVASVAAAVGVACSGGGEDSTGTPTLAATPTEVFAGSPTPSATPGPGSEPSETVTTPVYEQVLGGAPRRVTEGGYELVPILAPDAIPAILDPEFVDAEAADEFLDNEDQILGVSINGEHHAYGTAFLSSHEIVNDVVGGVAIAATW